MTSTSSSRKGRSIAKKACDCCRLRKTQCSFGPDGPDACIKCLASKVPCTFLQDRRPRGPVSRRLAQFRQVASYESHGSMVESKHHPSPSCSDASQHTTSPQQASSILTSADTNPRDSPTSGLPLPLPLGQVSVEHFVGEHTFLEIIQDFQDRIYPSLPLVYLPDLRHALKNRLYLTDTACLRLCFALCAVTVASIPRKFGQYSQGAYVDNTEMVGRACQLVLLSRLATNVSWQNTPTHASMVVSALLAQALLYVGSASMGWTYASESIHSFRSLKLYRKESYAGLDYATAEICKRAFWTLYIIQIHDRMGFVHSHTGLGYDPLHTDWDFLLTVDDNAGQGETKETTVLAGFLIVNKVFLSVADLLSEVFPGQPPPCVLPLDRLGFGDLSEQSLFEYEQEPSLHSRKLRSFLRVRYRLQTILEKLPPSLRPMRQAVASSSVTKGKHHDQKLDLPDTGAVDGVLQDGYFSRSGTPPGEAEIEAVQMEAMWSNIQVTSLFIQSVFLEVCIDSLERGGGTGAAPELDMEAVRPMSLASPDSMPRGAVAVADPRLRAKLQEFRESIGSDLLEVVNACSLVTLESHGDSMIVKIREIAATLLDGKDTGMAECEGQEKRRWHVAQFVQVLAKLDYAWQQASCQSGVGRAPAPD